MTDIDYDSNIQKLLDFDYILGTANLKNNSLLARAISIACLIPSPNTVVLGVILGRSLERNSCSECFHRTREVINEGLTY